MKKGRGPRHPHPHPTSRSVKILFVVLVVWACYFTAIIIRDKIFDFSGQHLQLRVEFRIGIVVAIAMMAYAIVRMREEKPRLVAIVELAVMAAATWQAMKTELMNSFFERSLLAAMLVIGVWTFLVSNTIHSVVKKNP